MASIPSPSHPSTASLAPSRMSTAHQPLSPLLAYFVNLFVLFLSRLYFLVLCFIYFLTWLSMSDLGKETQ